MRVRLSGRELRVVSSTLRFVTLEHFTHTGNRFECDAELRNLEGGFNITRAFNDRLLDNTSPEFDSLQTLVQSGVSHLL